MNEIKQQLSEKLGLSEEMSEQAIEMVLGFLKTKLPDNVSGLIDSAMEGGEMPDVGGLLDQAKGFFGK